MRLVRVLFSPRLNEAKFEKEVHRRDVLRVHVRECHLCRRTVIQTPHMLEDRVEHLERVSLTPVLAVEYVPHLAPVPQARSTDHDEVLVTAGVAARGGVAPGQRVS